MIPAVRADIAAIGPSADELHGPPSAMTVSPALMSRTRTRSRAVSTAVVVDQRHHGRRLATKVAAGIPAR